ncbi:MAG: hypothetical protein WKF90_02640 [Pyrinomonadaceae bacterium]
MIISIKSSASGGSSRGLVHYLAHSKLAREKEAVERREFFSESENDLDVRKANRHLSLGAAKPKPEELLHVVIAPSKEEIAKLGTDREERKTALKEVVRETVARLEKEVKARHLKWVAVAHFNTDNPHAHLALQKQFTNENGKTEILRMNRQMLHYNVRGANGEKTLHKGALILAAENKIEDIAGERRKTLENEKSSEPEKVAGKSKNKIENFKRLSSDKPLQISNFDERRILAEEMLALAEIRRRERNIENLVEHGDKKRFKIKDDQTGNTRHVSLFDIERRIETISRRKSRVAHPKNAEKRAEFSVQIAEEERAKYEPFIRQLETIRRHVLGFENRHLSEAQEKHTRLHNQKLLIEKKYERLKTDVPLPLFNPDEIQQLQTAAISEQNSEKTLRLEGIRQSNAAESGLPSRRDEDVRELLATKIISKLKIEAAEKRLLGFAANKDFIKVKIEDSLLSHHELRQHELEAARKNDLWTQVKLKTSDFLFPSDKKSRSAEKLDYPALHKAVSEGLENLENTRREEIAKQKEFNQTLDKIFDAETNPNKTRFAPAFSAFELSDMEDLAHDAGRESFYENSLLLQESWLRERLAVKISQANVLNEAPAPNDDKTQKRRALATEITAQFDSETQAEVAAEKVIGNFVLGRAEARSLLAQIKVNQAEEILTHYDRDKAFIKHRIKDSKTGAECELSLRDVEPRKHYYLLDSMLERAFETKEKKTRRDAVRQAAQNRETELAQDLKPARNRALRFGNQKTLMLEKFSEATEVQPIFTPKEVAALNAWRDRTINKSESDRIGKIITEAENFGRVERLQELLQKAEKELQIIAPVLTKKQESKISRDDDLTDGRQTVVKSQEISYKNVVLEKTNHDGNKSTEFETTAYEKVAAREKGRTR